MNLAQIVRTLSQPISRLSLRGPAAYGFAAGMIALAALVRWMLPDLGSRVPFPTFFIAVFVSAWVGGLRAGLFASVLTVLSGILLFPITRPPWDWRDTVALMFVFSVCLFSAYTCSRLRASIDLIDRDRDWYKRILERVGDAVLVADEAGYLRYFNGHAASLWGIDDSFLNRPVSEVARFTHETTGQPFDDLDEVLASVGRGCELPAGLEVRIGNRSVPVTGHVSRFLDPDYGLGTVLSVQSILALREASRRVEHSERRLRALFDSGIVGILGVDASGKVSSLNPAMRQFLAIGEAAVGGRPLVDIAPPELVAHLARHAHASEATPPEDIQVKRPDGSHVWLSIGSARVGRGETMVLAIDVSSRKCAEKALAGKERALRLILDAVPARIAYISRDGVLQWANRSFADWFGPGRLQGRRAAEVLQQPVLDVLQDALSGASTQPSGQTEWLEDNPRFGRRWTTTSFSPDLDEKGDLRGVISLCMDSTERHETEEALRRNEAEHRTLAENVPHMVWMADANGQVQYGNSRWIEYTGADIGSLWTEALHRHDVAAADAAIASAARSKSEIGLEVRIRRASDGAHRWHLLRVLPLVDEQGSVLRWYASCTDIDDQRMAQETLREAHRRTTHFLATLSHELRNPLAALAAGTQLLRDPRSDAAVLAETSAAIERQTAHLKRLTDDLLDISRITLGRIQISRELIDLREVCRTAPADFAEKAAHYGVTVRQELPRQPVIVFADRARMRQCVDNLVSNAIKASSPGMVVQMSLVTRQRFAEITILDEGVGMEPDDMGAIFAPFTQSQDWRSRGLGLGLSIVSKLVELHGGSVEADSGGRNMGSRFTLRVPLAKASELALAASGNAGNGVAATATGSVLIVDDEVDNASALGSILQLEGHEVHIAEDGIAAITVAEREHPDVVICDLGLPPPMDGLEVGERLRRMLGSAAFLCAYSGYGAREDVQRSLNAGFDMHMTKPGRPSEIVRMVGEAVARVNPSSRGNG